MLPAAAFATAFVLSPLLLRSSGYSSRGVRCAAADHFEELLQSILQRVEAAGPKAAVATMIGDLNESFMPWLSQRIETAQDVEAAQLEPVIHALQTIYATKSDADPEADEVQQARWAATDELLSSHWRSLDGTIDEEEEAYVDSYDSPPGRERQLVFERPSAYGEVTRAGGRRLFEAMGLHCACGAVFADLGSGAGRLVAQAWLELPSLEQAVGIELAPSRHAAAVRAWTSAVSSGAVKPFEDGRLSDGPEFRSASMLETDLSAVTHAYVASLCMNDALLDGLWERLRSSAPELRVAATLRPFPGEAAAAALSHVARVQMTWNRQGGPGTEVFVYRFEPG